MLTPDDRRLGRRRRRVAQRRQRRCRSWAAAALPGQLRSEPADPHGDERQRLLRVHRVCRRATTACSKCSPTPTSTPATRPARSEANTVGVAVNPHDAFIEQLVEPLRYRTTSTRSCGFNCRPAAFPPHNNFSEVQVDRDSDRLLRRRRSTCLRRPDHGPPRRRPPMPRPFARPLLDIAPPPAAAIRRRAGYTWHLSVVNAGFPRGEQAARRRDRAERFRADRSSKPSPRRRACDESAWTAARRRRPAQFAAIASA